MVSGKQRMIGVPVHSLSRCGVHCGCSGGGRINRNSKSDRVKSMITHSKSNDRGKPKGKRKTNSRTNRSCFRTRMSLVRVRRTLFGRLRLPGLGEGRRSRGLMRSVRFGSVEGAKLVNGVSGGQAVVSTFGQGTVGKGTTFRPVCGRSLGFGA